MRVGEHHSEKKGGFANIALANDSEEIVLFSDSGGSDIARRDEEMDIDDRSIQWKTYKEFKMSNRFCLSMQPAFYDDSDSESETDGETQLLLSEANKKIFYMSERQAIRTRSSQRVGIVNHDESSFMNISGIQRGRTNRFKSSNDVPDTNR